MKKTYAIEVDCANCANLMEEAAGKTAGVASVVVNFMMQKMTLVADDARFDEILDEAQKTIHKFEPDCNIIR